jgi:AsmA family protein
MRAGNAEPTKRYGNRASVIVACGPASRARFRERTGTKRGQSCWLDMTRPEGSFFHRNWKWLAPLATVAVAIVVAIAVWDWNWFKGPLAARLTLAAGRSVTIDGPLDVDLGRVTRITLRGLAIANERDFEGEHLATAEEIRVALEVMPLLRGRLVIDRVAVKHPNLNLVRHKDGTGNWNLGRAQPESKSDGAERDEIPVVRLMTLEGGELMFTDQSRDMKLKGSIGAIGQSDEDAPKVDLKVQGTLAGRQLRIAIDGGSIMMLKESREPYPFTIDAVLSETKVRFEGTAIEPMKLQGVEAKVAAEGPNAADLFPLFGIPAPETPPFSVTADLRRGAETYEITSLKGKIGDSDISGDMNVDPRGKRLGVKGKLHSKMLDFDDVGPMLGLPPATGPGETASPEQRRQAEALRKSPRILPDAKLSLDKVRAVDAELVYTADKVNAPGAPLEGVAVTAILKDAVLDIKPLRLGVAGGRAEAIIRLDARRDIVNTNADIRFNGFDLKQFFEAAPVKNAAQGEMYGRVQVAGRGNSIREMLGGANGQVGAIVDHGIVSNLLMELAGLDIFESLGLIATKDKPVTLNCFVVDMVIENGLAQPRALVLDSSDTTITAEGPINLKDESLNVTMKPHPKDVSLLSVRVPVHIRGTLKSPSITPDAAALAARGGAAAALGVLLTPVAALLAFIDPGDKIEVNCPALVDAAPKPPAKKKQN